MGTEQSACEVLITMDGHYIIFEVNPHASVCILSVDTLYKIFTGWKLVKEHCGILVSELLPTSQAVSFFFFCIPCRGSYES